MLILGSNHLPRYSTGYKLLPEYGSSRVFATGSFRIGFTLQTKQTPFSEYFLTFIFRYLSNRAPKPLECKRQTLYEEEKPSKEFLEWAKLLDEKRSDKPPPLAS
jgi:hypothetical protein